jgi:hypothetical protein
VKFTITDEQREELKGRNWSNSSMSSFEACPYAFYRQYVLKDRRELPSTFFGSAVHEVAELYTLGKSFDPEEIFTRFKVPPSEKADYDYSVKQVKNFIDVKVSPFRNTPELEIITRIGKYNYIMILDGVVHDGDTIRIYDWKTSKTTKYSSSYDYVMNMYKFVCKREFPGKKVTIDLYYPRINETKGLGHVEITEEGLNKQVDNILACEDFQPTKHKFCNWCAYKKKECPAFKLR